MQKLSDDVIHASHIIPLWMYSWPAILRGRNLIGITQQENVKKLTYLPALLSVVLHGRNLPLPKGTSVSLFYCVISLYFIK